MGSSPCVLFQTNGHINPQKKNEWPQNNYENDALFPFQPKFMSKHIPNMSSRPIEYVLNFDPQKINK